MLKKLCLYIFAFVVVFFVQIMYAENIKLISLTQINNEQKDKIINYIQKKNLFTEVEIFYDKKIKDEIFFILNSTKKDNTLFITEISSFLIQQKHKEIFSILKKNNLDGFIYIAETFNIYINEDKIAKTENIEAKYKILQKTELKKEITNEANSDISLYLLLNYEKLLVNDDKVIPFVDTISNSHGLGYITAKIKENNYFLLLSFGNVAFEKQDNQNLLLIENNLFAKLNLGISTKNIYISDYIYFNINFNIGKSFIISDFLLDAKVEKSYYNLDFSTEFIHNFKNINIVLNIGVNIYIKKPEVLTTIPFSAGLMINL